MEASPCAGWKSTSRSNPPVGRRSPRSIEKCGFTVICQHAGSIRNECPRNSRNLRFARVTINAARNDDVAIGDVQLERMRQRQGHALIASIAHDLEFRLCELAGGNPKKSRGSTKGSAPIDIEMHMTGAEKRCGGIAATDLDIRKLGGVHSKRDAIESKPVATAFGDRTDEHPFDRAVGRKYRDDEDRDDDTNNAPDELHVRAAAQQSTIGATAPERPACGKP